MEITTRTRATVTQTRRAVVGTRDLVGAETVVTQIIGAIRRTIAAQATTTAAHRAIAVHKHTATHKRIVSQYATNNKLTANQFATHRHIANQFAKLTVNQPTANQFARHIVNQYAKPTAHNKLTVNQFANQVAIALATTATVADHTATRIVDRIATVADRATPADMVVGMGEDMVANTKSLCLT